MEDEKPAGTVYSLLLIGGLLVLVGLGLIGLPVATAILLAFAAAVLGVFLYAVWEIAVGYRQAAARRRRAAAPVQAPARLRSSA